MVQNSRKTPGLGALRPLNVPAPIDVLEDAQHSPMVISLRGRRLKVASIDDLWEIGEEWWRDKPVARTYYQVTAEDGRCVTLFRDLVSGGWYQQRG